MRGVNATSSSCRRDSAAAYFGRRVPKGVAVKPRSPRPRRSRALVAEDSSIALDKAPDLALGCPSVCMNSMRLLRQHRRLMTGSVPARAFKKNAHASEHVPSGANVRPGSWSRSVYPRACGGTRSVRQPAFRPDGLSPRVRGNRRCAAAWEIRFGSIPARAGEPSQRTRRSRPRRVYPRACGGTAGNAAAPLTVGVYPRACGGTRQCVGHSHSIRGLSPRVRGIRSHISSPVVQQGSIPARAGEPASKPSGDTFSRVYPRACGGTTAEDRQVIIDLGLSPRVRGNRCTGRHGARASGSIPARAGEPDPRP